MRHVSLADMPCPIARTLDLVGEWWTLLVIRDALLGARRFEDFRRVGIADNILTARLKKLCDAGILQRQVYQTRPHRSEYVLTNKGRALAPVVAALREWGQEWTSGEDRSPRLLHVPCGHEITVGVYCPECGRTVTIDEVHPCPSSGPEGAARAMDNEDNNCVN